VEVPHLNALYNKYKEKGLVVLGINQEENYNNLKEYIEGNIDYPVLVDANQQFEDYQIQGIPCTYYVDHEGKINKRDVGFGEGNEVTMEQIIVELLR